MSAHPRKARPFTRYAVGVALIFASGCDGETLPPEGDDPTLSCPEGAAPAAGEPVLVFGLGRDEGFVPLEDGASLARGEVLGEPALTFTVRWFEPATHGTIAIDFTSNDGSGLAGSTTAPNALGCEAWMEAEVHVGVGGDLPAGVLGTLHATGKDEQGAELASAEVDVVTE